LSAVRNVGEGLVSLILQERERNGPFRDFYDFCDRVDTQVLNKRTVESLIKAGAFDSLGHPRQGLLMVFEQIIDRVLARRRKEAEGQFELFAALDAGAGDAGGFDDTRIEIPDLEFDRKTRLAFEKEMLGLYVSDHPLKGAEGLLRRRSECSILELEAAEDGAVRSLGGLVTNLQRKWTRKGDLMAVFVLEDLQATIECMVFPKTMQTHGHLLEDDAIVVVKGRVDKRDDTPKLIAMEIEVLSDLVTDESPPVRIKLPISKASQPVLEHLKNLLSEHPGSSQVFLHVGDKQVLRLPNQFSVDASNGLVAELRVLLGENAVLV
jgi:DNA polymerase-3 subunit alpha